MGHLLFGASGFNGIDTKQVMLKYRESALDLVTLEESGVEVKV